MRSLKGEERLKRITSHTYHLEIGNSGEIRNLKEKKINNKSELIKKSLELSKIEKAQKKHRKKKLSLIEKVRKNQRKNIIYL